MSLLNKEVENSLGTWTKAFKDGDPEIPQITLQRWAGTIYNSILSGFGTAANVAVGNVGGLVDNSLATLAGSFMMGNNGKQIRSDMAASLMSITNTTSEALGHARNKLWQGFTDPKALDKSFRPDVYMAGQEKIEALESFAMAAAARGDEGAMVAFNHFKMMNDLQQDPIFRMVPNFMTATDAFQSSFIASQQAKMKAYGKLYSKYGDDLTTGLANSSTMKEEWASVTKEIYDELFPDGILKKGTEAEYLKLQQTLALDTPIARSMNEWTKQFPLAKAVFMFPKTMGNIAQGILNYTPVNAFADDVGAFNKPLKGLDFDYMQEALAKRGMTAVAPEEVMGTFMRERARVRGRMAAGAMLTTSISMLALNGDIRGAEHRDQAIQRARGKDWKPYTVRIPGTNNWVDYSWMGPPAKMIGLIPTAIDNFDGLRTGSLEDFLPKISYTLASMFDDVNGVEMLKPIMDIASNNGDRALARFTAQHANSMIPLATQRSEWGKLLNPTQRLYEKDFTGYFRNRNTWLDAFLPGTALLEAGDPISGKKLGGNQSPLMRMYNTYSPMPISEGQDPLRDFLTKIEWNGKESMTVSTTGVQLTPQEQQEMWQIIYRDGEFRKDLKWIKQRANDMNYIKKLRKIRRDNIWSDTLTAEDFLDIQELVNQSLNKAKANAEIQLSTYDRILTAEYLAGQNEARAKSGDTNFYSEVDGILRLTQP